MVTINNISLSTYVKPQDSSVRDKYPVAQDSSVRDKYPVAQGSSARDKYPVAQDSSVRDKYPVAQDSSVRDKYPVAQDSSVRERYPVAQGSSARDKYPISQKPYTQKQYVIRKSIPEQSDSKTTGYSGIIKSKKQTNFKDNELLKDLESKQDSPNINPLINNPNSTDKVKNEKTFINDSDLSLNQKTITPTNFPSLYVSNLEILKSDINTGFDDDVLSQTYNIGKPVDGNINTSNTLKSSKASYNSIMSSINDFSHTYLGQDIIAQSEILLMQKMTTPSVEPALPNYRKVSEILNKDGVKD